MSKKGIKMVSDIVVYRHVDITYGRTDTSTCPSNHSGSTTTILYEFLGHQLFLKPREKKKLEKMNKCKSFLTWTISNRHSAFSHESRFEIAIMFCKMVIRITERTHQGFVLGNSMKMSTMGQILKFILASYIQLLSNSIHN